ncbi:MAG: hypothetical protein IIA73_08245 [Proteobacteria bacterium]|nr:hypothetical protein [Pseudomonadota bacterium]
MSSTLITFNEARTRADQIRDGEAEPANRAKLSKRTKQTQLASVDVEESRDDLPTDREIALRVSRAIGELQDAIDAAILAGLMVEPSFKPISGRFNEFGVSMDSYVCSVQMYRKLA